MSEIPSGFKKLNKKLSDVEIARIGLIAELDAINLYEQLAALTNNKRLKATLKEIAYEEKIHVGEFMEVIKELDPEQIKALDKGKREVEEK